MKPTTIKEAINLYLDAIILSRSENTARTYRNGINMFCTMLEDHNLPVQTTDIKELPEDAIAWFAASLKTYSSNTERLYLTAANGFFEYLAAERITSPNLPRIKLLIRQRARRPGLRLPQFPRDIIEKVIVYSFTLSNVETENVQERLRNMRDRAFILTLSDTGLRVHEACALRRGSIEWNEGRAIIIGKGNQESVIRFSQRSIRAIKDYLHERSKFDGASGKPLSSLPVFARHDKGAGKNIKPITTKTGRKIIEYRVTKSVGKDYIGKITPHSFRHYFVTVVLASSGNLKLAQELARHRNITVTQRYAHLADDELDRRYTEIFDN